MMTDQFDVAPETMSGDIRDILLNYIRNLQKSWAETPEDEQRAAVQAVDAFSREFVTQLVQVVKAQGLESADAEIVDFKVKGTKLRLVLELAASDKNTLLLLHNMSGHVTVTSADTSGYIGAKDVAEAHVQRDQPDMIENGIDHSQTTQEMPEGDAELHAERKQPIYGDMNAQQLKTYEKHHPDYWAGVEAAKTFNPTDAPEGAPKNPHDARTNRGKMWAFGFAHMIKLHQESQENAPTEPAEPEAAEPLEETGPDAFEGAPAVEDSQGGFEGPEAELAKQQPAAEEAPAESPPPGTTEEDPDLAGL